MVGFNGMDRIGYCRRAAVLSGLLMLTAAGTAQQAPSVDTTPPQAVPTAPGLKVLFGGTQADMESNWLQGSKPAHWKIEEGAMVSVGGDIATKEKFTNYQLHIEFRVPYMPDKKGQGRGNSGVFMQGRYEIQVLDSYGIKEPGTGDCGAVYHQSAPLVNACKPPLQWQTYDIAYHAPHYDPTDHAKLLESARVTVVQNGLVVQNEQVITGLTHIVTPPKNPPPIDPNAPPKPAAPPEDLSTPGPIRLQFHNNTVAFRNVWILPLPDSGAKHYEPRGSAASMPQVESRRLPELSSRSDCGSVATSALASGSKLPIRGRPSAPSVRSAVERASLSVAEAVTRAASSAPPAGAPVRGSMTWP